MKGRLPIIRKWGRDLEAGTEYKSSFINWLKFDSFLFGNSFYFRITKENSVLNPLQEAADEWNAPKLRLKCSFLSSFFLCLIILSSSLQSTPEKTSPQQQFFLRMHTKTFLLQSPFFPDYCFLIKNEKWT